MKTKIIQGSIVLGAEDSADLFKLWDLAESGEFPSNWQISCNCWGQAYLAVENSANPGYKCNGIMYKNLRALRKAIGEDSEPLSDASD